MTAKLSKSQRAVMGQLALGWKAYVAYGSRVEINGRPVCTAATMAALEQAGLVEKIGVAAWAATEAGRAFRDKTPK
jgi:hypothetical protein